MNLHDRDEYFMRRALSLAKKGGTAVRPNPPVGCVIVRSGKIVGEGYHKVFGGPHAEPLALRKAGSRAHGATAYVTLEPCCHIQKKTPPCVPALIQAGIRRAVIASSDPNPRVSGKGIAQLRRAGIRVTSGVLEPQGEGLLRPFTTWILQHRPHVILKAAASLDGRIETASGQSQWITGTQSRMMSHRIRADIDAILVGVDTVIQDNSRLTARGHGKNPIRIVLDSDLRVPRKSRVLNEEAPTIIATTRDERTSLKKSLPPNVQFLRFPKSCSGINLNALLNRLYKMRIAVLLVEGGSRVHTSFLEAGLVDEVRLFLAPRLIGGSKARSFFEGRGVKDLRHTLDLSDMEVRQVGADLLVTGHLRRHSSV